jgi:hypothetical protein
MWANQEISVSIWRNGGSSWLISLCKGFADVVIKMPAANDDTTSADQGARSIGPYRNVSQ